MKTILYKVVKLLKKVKVAEIASTGGKNVTPMDIPKKMTFQITFFTLRIILLFGLSFGNTVEIATAFPAPKDIAKADDASVLICQNSPLSMQKSTLA